MKSKGEKERYTHLNAEFQRIASRDKKAFLSNQCKEIEENNRMGKTRELFKEIRGTNGTFHAKMGSIKDCTGYMYSISCILSSVLIYLSYFFILAIVPSTAMIFGVQVCF